MCVTKAHSSLITGDLDDVSPHMRNGLYPCYSELLPYFPKSLSFCLCLLVAMGPGGYTEAGDSHFPAARGGILVHVS